MHKEHLSELIDKYLKGTASEEERTELEIWYRSFDTKHGFVEFLSLEQKKSLEQRLWKSIDDAESDPQPDTAIRSLPSTRTNFGRWLVAASVVFVVCFALVKYRGQQIIEKKHRTNITAARAEIKKVLLPDGSNVWLNAESKISFLNNFSGSSREVWLEGEAYFDVAHDSTRAFLIHSGRLTTRVLGTAFNIDAYNKNRNIVVSVTRGKVAVGDAQTKTMATLLPGKQVDYNVKTQSFQVNRVDAASLSEWRTGKLVYKNTPFEEIAQRLERKFNVQISFTDARIGKCKLTAMFDEKVPLDDILKMLCKVNGTQYKKEKGRDAYVIFGTPCKVKG